MSKQSSPDLTARSAALLAAARRHIHPGDRVVDLGAGRKAVLARALQETVEGCEIIAVEPHVKVDAPAGIEVIEGDISALPESSVDVVLFNAPNTPDRFLDENDLSYHQFAGGPDGYQVFHAVLAESLTRLKPGGRFLCICPTFTPLPELHFSQLTILDHLHEPKEPFFARAPILPDKEKEYADFLASRIETLQPLWEALGVPHDPDSVTAAILSITQPREPEHRAARDRP